MDFKTNTSSGVDTEQAALKAKHQRLFRRGLKWLGAGIALMALSFCINFFLHGSSGGIITTMYILTSIGTACIIKGLVDMMG